MSTPRLVETFVDLCRIDSPTREEGALARELARRLEEIGCEVGVDASATATGSDTGNLIAELAGTRPGTLVLSAHMDCVEPCRGVEPVERDGVISSAGDTILGADDKAGLAVCLEVLQRLVESGEPYPTIRCLFTVAEEVGLVGAKALDPSDVYGDLCLVLDADGRPGQIVVAAPTHYTFKAQVVGRPAHAGVAPEQGISAIEMAADAVSRMRLGRIDADSTANVGSIEGGSATNVVTPVVSLTGECRSIDRPTVEALRAEMQAALEAAVAERGGDLAIDWTLEYEGFVHDADDPWLALLRDAAEAAGVEPGLLRTGGGSDANILASSGVPTFALACGMTDVHGVHESVRVDGLEALARFTLAIARRLNGGGMSDAARMGHGARGR